MEGYWERWVRKRKSWVSSVRSVSGAEVSVGRGLSSSRSAIVEEVVSRMGWWGGRYVGSWIKWMIVFTFVVQ